MNSVRIMSEHPGQKLKLLRESKGITLEQASQDTCMRRGLLEALEESPGDDLLPSVYRKLSLRMYARYLGVECEMTRRVTPVPQERKGFSRMMPARVYLRRMGRTRIPSRLDSAKRDRLLSIAKMASVAVVVVLGVGLWSLNAKISRLHLDETLSEPAAVLLSPEPATPPPPQEKPASSPETPLMFMPSFNIEEPISLTFHLPVHGMWCESEEKESKKVEKEKVEG